MGSSIRIYNEKVDRHDLISKTLKRKKGIFYNLPPNSKI